MRGSVVFLIAAMYLVVGLAFGNFARMAPSSGARAGWRLAAWVISAVVFGVHIWYEQVRQRRAPASTARRAALAVAVGAFGVAVAASLHGRAVHHVFPASALVAWPVLTGLVAFVVALGVATLVATLYRRTTPDGAVR